MRLVIVMALVLVRFFGVMLKGRRDVMDGVRVLVGWGGAEEQTLLEVFDLWA
jgi:hypothetical protein